ncbi:ABC transporter permease [Paenibacillus sp. Leaf72]|uniref:ABC transporter permease n=1 Tax=Paenibacillus sp. Leaf72 TaxID=1736234 RepID=UPI0006FE99AA|nr:ABC transporter permease [Paenibacillus sp. Leaf72]KQO18011.1 hypothetical protein ASF12_05015 [Paenibacillus sp. Leaf72]
MNFRQFAFNNVLRRKRTYAAHFMSSSFAVMIFFIYSVLLYHPDLQGQIAASSPTASMLGTMGLKISQYLIVIFSFLFLMYSAGAFLKARKREFGILMLLGMSDKQYRRLIFVENMIIGLLSTVFGIGFGILFTKLFLLITERLLVLQKGLEFLVPIQSVIITTGAFFIVFLLLSILASRLGRKSQLLELIRSDEKPKKEPKASVLLSLLAAILLLAGYGMVFYFVLGRAFSLALLAAAIGCVILGTYFLFTQLSVYVIRALRGRESLLLRKINLLTLSDLAYRMRDNANMFFMVATVTAVALCGMGTCLAIGDPKLSEKDNPYAFIYESFGGDSESLAQNERQTKQHLALLEHRLSEGGFAYTKGASHIKYTEDWQSVMSLSEYNQLATTLGFSAETLHAPSEAFIASGKVSRAQNVTAFEPVVDLGNVAPDEKQRKLTVVKRLPSFVLNNYNDVYVVSDDYFQAMIRMKDDTNQVTYYYVIPNWIDTISAAQSVMKEIPQDTQGHYYIRSLVIEWYEFKQLNGLLLIISVLVGGVFFTYAVSFIYFRLYADLERDEKQYQMISKIGLSGKELNRLVTRQLLLMFFLPFAIALVHGIVAFINIALLLDISMLKAALLIYISFFLLQLTYFLMIRWRYLRHMHLKLT